MIIDGEKWACEACVRGHRVSNCNHNDRPLVHVNKKGRPVSQCAHCRGLRRNRTTHTRCECGDKKKKQKREVDVAADKEDRQRCGCPFGLRCTCALKKEPLDTVPETGLPPSKVAELKKPQLTATKSESTLATVRDHKPARHNDMTHKRGTPYTIPRSHTVHSTPNARSSDDLPLELDNYLGRSVSESQRLVKSEHDTPESTPVTSVEDASVPSLDLAGLFPARSLGESPEGPSGLLMPTNSDDELDHLASSVAPPTMSLPSFPTTEASPLGQLTFHDPYQEAYHASSDNDMPVGPGFSAPPVDWSSFPIHPSDFAATASTQPPSYASLDYSYCSSQPGLPAPPSSGEMSELDEFGPLSNLNRTSDLRDSSDTDATQLRINTSTYMSMPQTQLVSATNLESIDIDEFLRSANASTAAMEQFQANMGHESKSSSPDHEHVQTTVPMTTSTDPIWSSNLYASGASSTMDENFFPNSWGRGQGPSS